MSYVIKFNTETGRYNAVRREERGISSSVSFRRKEDAEKLCSEYNEEIENGSAIVQVCKDCGRKFCLLKSDIEWYMHRTGAKIPKRCEKCREKRRIKLDKAKANKKSDGEKACIDTEEKNIRQEQASEEALGFVEID